LFFRQWRLFIRKWRIVLVTVLVALFAFFGKTALAVYG